MWTQSDVVQHPGRPLRGQRLFQAEPLPPVPALRPRQRISLHKGKHFCPVPRIHIYWTSGSKNPDLLCPKWKICLSQIVIKILLFCLREKFPSSRRSQFLGTIFCLVIFVFLRIRLYNAAFISLCILRILQFIPSTGILLLAYDGILFWQPGSRSPLPFLLPC